MLRVEASEGGGAVPASTVGRLVAALVSVVGIGFLTVVTAAITSTFLDSAKRRLEGTETDGCLRSSTRSASVWR
jgi:hypothetical protein